MITKKFIGFTINQIRKLKGEKMQSKTKKILIVISIIVLLCLIVGLIGYFSVDVF